MVQSKHQLKVKRKRLQQKTGKGVQEPLVLKETAPKVEGVLILCEGGDNITIKEAISKACQALFNVPAHKIEVLKMK